METKNGFHRISTACGNPRETFGNPQRFPQPVEILWKALETTTGLHLISTACGNPVETRGNPKRFPQPVEIRWKPVETTSGFHMISTGFGNHVETNGNQQGFHTISTGCGNPVETRGKQKLFPLDFHSLWKSCGNQWKPTEVSTSCGMWKLVETTKGFHSISTGCGNPVETHGNQRKFPHEFHRLWKSCGNPVETELLPLLLLPLLLYSVPNSVPV